MRVVRGGAVSVGVGDAGVVGTEVVVGVGVGRVVGEDGDGVPADDVSELDVAEEAAVRVAGAVSPPSCPDPAHPVDTSVTTTDTATTRARRAIGAMRSPTMPSRLPVPYACPVRGVLGTPVSPRSPMASPSDPPGAASTGYAGQTGDQTGPGLGLGLAQYTTTRRPIGT